MKKQEIDSNYFLFFLNNNKFYDVDLHLTFEKNDESQVHVGEGSGSVVSNYSTRLAHFTDLDCVNLGSEVLIAACTKGGVTYTLPAFSPSESNISVLLDPQERGFKLRLDPVKSVVVLLNGLQVITFDIKGCMRVWNASTAQLKGITFTEKYQTGFRLQVSKHSNKNHFVW